MPIEVEAEVRADRPSGPRVPLASENGWQRHPDWSSIRKGVISAITAAPDEVPGLQAAVSRRVATTSPSRSGLQMINRQSTALTSWTGGSVQLALDWFGRPQI